MSAVEIILLAGTATAGTHTRPGGCRPGDIEIDEDCSAQEVAEAACESAHNARVATVDIAPATATAACALG